MPVLARLGAAAGRNSWWRPSPASGIVGRYPIECVFDQGTVVMLAQVMAWLGHHWLAVAAAVVLLTLARLVTRARAPRAGSSDPGPRLLSDEPKADHRARHDEQVLRLHEEMLQIGPAPGRADRQQAHNQHAGPAEAVPADQAASPPAGADLDAEVDLDAFHPWIAPAQGEGADGLRPEQVWDYSPPLAAGPPLDLDAEAAPAIAEAEEAEFELVDIFFGTDRLPEATPGRYAGRRGRALRTGVATVSAPKDRPAGSIPRPRKLFLLTLEKEDPARHFVVRSSEELDAVAFQARLREAQTACGEHPALLFVHGYNTPFEGALYRAAQLAIDLSVTGPMLLYSWPSRGKLGLQAYDYDRESVKQARVHFAAFLDRVFASGVRRLNILAHSMGNDLLLETLDDHPRTRLKGLQQIVLASPDVDADVAANLVPRVSPKAKSMTLYACSEDLAIGVSKTKAGGARAGGLLDDGYPLIAAGLDSIDASSCTLRLMEFNHNSFVADTVLRYDLAALLAWGRRPPDKRSPSITLETCARGQYWLLQAR
jgi:esterase/lipase superfamily enzyme